MKSADPKAAATAPNMPAKVQAGSDVAAAREAKAAAADPNTPAQVQARSDAAAALEAKATTSASDTVWFQVDGPGEWAPCKVVTRTANGGIMLKVKNKDVTVRPEDIPSQILPQPGREKLTQNLAELPRDGLGSQGIEDVIRQQVCNMLPYTNIGDVLLVVNPMREIPIYDSKWIDKYAELKASLPPHIYNTSAMAFKTLTEKRTSQAILLTGRPGSGKSRAMGHLLAFLVQTAGSEPVDQLLSELEDVLRPFLSIRLESGSLKWSSTRSLFMLELSFDEDDFICRAAASVKLLESRAARPGDGANFDVFCKALRDREEAKRWLGEKEEFKLLGEEFDLEEYDTSGQELYAWKKALKTFGIDPVLIVRVLCGLLLLGEVTFASAKTGNGITCSGHEQAAKALGIEAAELAEGLVRAGDTEAADVALRDTIEDMYRSVLKWTLQKANEAMVGDSKPVGPTITIVDTPSFPSGWPATLPVPTGFDAVQLQWLTETMKFHLVDGALQPKMQEENLSLDLTRLESFQATEAALGAIGGRDGLVAKICQLAKQKAPATKKDLEALGKELCEQASCSFVKGASGEARCKISGAAGEVEHVLDDALLRGSLGPSMPAKVRKTMLQSSLKPVCEILRTRMESSDAEEAEDAVGMIQSMLLGKERLRPWIISCMRPNDKGSDKLVSLPVLQAQVEELLLSHMVHLTGQTQSSYSMAWSMANFHKQYASLMVDTRTNGIEGACRALVESMGSNQGTVGSHGVYATKALVTALDKKMQDSESRNAAKTTSSKADEKAREPKAPSGPVQQDSESRDAAKMTSSKADEKAREPKAPSLPVQQPVKKQQQQASKDICSKCMTVFPDSSGPFCGKCGTKRQFQDSSKRPPQRAPKSMNDKIDDLVAQSPSLPSSSDDEATKPSSKAGNRGPFRSMALSQHAALHATLSQMASVLRVAKESETNLRKSQTSRDAEVQELRQECGVWRQESDRLWVQVKELQQLVQEGNLWRHPHST